MEQVLFLGVCDEQFTVIHLLVDQCQCKPELGNAQGNLIKATAEWSNMCSLFFHQAMTRVHGRSLNASSRLH